MARIRSISLEMLERMKPLTTHGRNLASSLSIVCDDAGRVVLDPEDIAAILFPGEPAAVDQLGEWLAELERHGWVERYTVAGIDYLRMIDWDADQRIDRPTASKLPPSPGEPLANHRVRELARKLQGRDRNRSADQALAGDSRLIEPGTHTPAEGEVDRRLMVNDFGRIQESAEKDKQHFAAIKAAELKAKFAGVHPPGAAIVTDPVHPEMSDTAATADGDAANDTLATDLLPAASESTPSPAAANGVPPSA